LPNRLKETTMALDERARRQLHARLEAVLGHEEAMILMEHLPPLGWSEVATSRELEAVRIDLGGQIAELRGEMLERMAGQTRSIVVAMVGTNAALATLVLAAVTLA
jgi:hypothetical protein